MIPIHPIIKQYIPLVDFLAQVMGPYTEIVLHDVSNIDCSVVAIKNNHISGRTVGSPATDLVLKILKDKKYKDKPFITNYRGISASGKLLKSSTYFIRDEQQHIIGLLCINIDYEKFAQFRNFLNELLDFPADNHGEDPLEHFSTSVKEIAHESIVSIMSKFDVSPHRMSQEEKIKIVKEMYDNGVFLLKGAIGEVASLLKTSEATIYRYLNKIKKESKES